MRNGCGRYQSDRAHGALLAHSPGTGRTVRVPRLRLDGRAGVRNFTHVADHQRHALVVLELADGLVVRDVEERLAIDLQQLVADLVGVGDTAVTEYILCVLTKSRPC